LNLATCKKALRCPICRRVVVKAVEGVRIQKPEVAYFGMWAFCTSGVEVGLNFSLGGLLGEQGIDGSANGFSATNWASKIRVRIVNAITTIFGDKFRLDSCSSLHKMALV
jgi:hypothetical protein